MPPGLVIAPPVERPNLGALILAARRLRMDQDEINRERAQEEADRAAVAAALQGGQMALPTGPMGPAGPELPTQPQGFNAAGHPNASPETLWRLGQFDEQRRKRALADAKVDQRVQEMRKVGLDAEADLLEFSWATEGKAPDWSDLRHMRRPDIDEGLVRGIHARDPGAIAQAMGAGLQLPASVWDPADPEEPKLTIEAWQASPARAAIAEDPQGSRYLPYLDLHVQQTGKLPAPSMAPDFFNPPAVKDAVDPAAAKLRLDRYVKALGGEANIDPVGLEILRDRAERGDDMTDATVRLLMKGDQDAAEFEVAIAKADLDEAGRALARANRRYDQAYNAAGGKLKAKEKEALEADQAAARTAWSDAKQRWIEAGRARTKPRGGARGDAVPVPGTEPAAPAGGQGDNVDAQIDAAIDALERRLGRPPTAEEVKAALGGGAP